MALPQQEKKSIHIYAQAAFSIIKISTHILTTVVMLTTKAKALNRLYNMLDECQLTTYVSKYISLTIRWFAF